MKGEKVKENNRKIETGVSLKDDVPKQNLGTRNNNLPFHG